MNKQKNNRPTFIKLGTVKDSTIKDNTARGNINGIDIKKLEDSEISGNKLIAPINSSKKKWYEKPYGLIFLGIVASLLAWLILHLYGLA